MIAALREQRVIPVLRSGTVDDAILTARACARAGMRVIELTRSTPDVAEAVRVLAREDLTIGVGTVQHASEVAPLVEAGASFVVSFCRPPGLVAAARTLGIASIPGALTPHEVAACAREGADAVKLFPARLLAPSYLRDLAPLLPGLPLIVTGGIAIDGVLPWLAAGATAVGLGSVLGTAADLGADEVERRARAALDAAHR